jgi:hypothetical protein
MGFQVVRALALQYSQLSSGCIALAHLGTTVVYLDPILSLPSCGATHGPQAFIHGTVLTLLRG